MTQVYPVTNYEGNFSETIWRKFYENGQEILNANATDYVQELWEMFRIIWSDSKVS